jgi:hypothetical protein
MLSNIPQKRRPQLQRGGDNKSRIITGAVWKSENYDFTRRYEYTCQIRIEINTAQIK